MAKDSQTQAFYQIQGVIQPYDWGLPAKESLAAALHGEAQDPESPCAELWLGVHPKGEANVVGPGDCRGKLSSLIPAEQGSLPFLLKVLSINRALSIQLHPSLQEAYRLHTKDPLHYPDCNHKPEMAVALTDDTYLLYGFRTKEVIEGYLQDYPEFAACVLREGLAALPEDEEAFRCAVYTALLQCPAALLKEQCTALYARLRATATSTKEEAYILSLQQYFPEGDNGIFTFFIHNLVHLPKGEALFIGPHIPHAYLQGQLIECMANSDNVIRAGLSSKFKDVDELLSLTDYTSGGPDYLQGIQDETCLRYAPPVEEFELCCYEGQKGTIQPRGTHALGLVYEGSGSIQGETVTAGFAFFIPAHRGPVSYDCTGARMVIAQAPHAES